MSFLVTITVYQSSIQFFPNLLFKSDRISRSESLLKVSTVLDTQYIEKTFLSNQQKYFVVPTKHFSISIKFCYSNKMFCCDNKIFCQDKKKVLLDTFFSQCITRSSCGEIDVRRLCSSVD